MWRVQIQNFSHWLQHDFAHKELTKVFQKSSSCMSACQFDSSRHFYRPFLLTSLAQLPNWYVAFKIVVLICFLVVQQHLLLWETETTSLSIVSCWWEMVVTSAQPSWLDDACVHSAKVKENRPKGLFFAEWCSYSVWEYAHPISRSKKLYWDKMPPVSKSL